MALNHPLNLESFGQRLAPRFSWVPASFTSVEARIARCATTCPYDRSRRCSTVKALVNLSLKRVSTSQPTYCQQLIWNCPMGSKSTSWTLYRKRNWLAGGLLIGGLPLAVAIAIVAKVYFNFVGEFVLILAILIWCCAWGWAAIRVARWPCPRCGNPWLSNQEIRIGAGRQCAKCGLSLYEEP